MRKLLCNLILVVALGSCGDDDKELRNMFQFKNDTTYNVQLIAYGESIKFLGNTENDTITIPPDNINGYSSICVGTFCEGSDSEPFRGLADSAKIVFNGTKQLMFFPDVKCNTNPLCRKAYERTVENTDLILTYTIGNNHFEHALEIK